MVGGAIGGLWEFLMGVTGIGSGRGSLGGMEPWFGPGGRG